MSKDPAQLIPDDEFGSSDLQRGTVVTGAGGPHGSVYATLDAQETDVPVGPCAWLPRWEGPDAASFPSVGDPCWIQFADDNTPVLAGWGTP